jgi:excisionase family DNA binding protein
MDAFASATDCQKDLPLLALRPREAAKALGIGERLLWEMTKNGEIPCVRLGTRLIIYPVDVLRDWLKGRASLPACGSDRTPHQT